MTLLQRRNTGSQLSVVHEGQGLSFQSISNLSEEGVGEDGKDEETEERHNVLGIEILASRSWH
jgi:hypothetical protein